MLAIPCLYLLLSFLIPIARPFSQEWQTTMPLTLRSLLSSLFISISLLAFVLLAIARKYNKIANVLNIIANEKIVYSFSLIFITLALALTAINNGGLWFTPISLGVQTCTVLIVYILLKGRMQKYESIITGVAVSCLAMGLWEIPYQIGYVLKTYPQEITMQKIYYEIMLQAPLIIGSIAILAVINKHYNNIKLNRLAAVLLFITVGLYASWFLTGFKLDILYDWNANQYIAGNEDYLTKILHRGSKVTLALGIIGVVGTRGRNE